MTGISKQAANMPDPPSYCGYCGRIRRRCVCHAAGSALQRFAQRGGQAPAPVQRATPYKRGVPPQIKRAERRAQQRHHKIWYAALVKTYGECCFNCGAADDLALDHVLPIAKGGRSALSNLQLLCAECNRLKGKLVIDCRALHQGNCIKIALNCDDKNQTKINHRGHREHRD